MIFHPAFLVRNPARVGTNQVISVVPHTLSSKREPGEPAGCLVLIYSSSHDH